MARGGFTPPLRAGFTLVEAMMATVVLVLIGGMTFAMAQTSPRVWSQTSQRLSSITDGQRVLDRVSEDIRYASAATLNCAPAAPNELTFTSKRGGVDAAVAYNQQGSDLLKNGQAMARGVTAFRALDCTGGRVVLQLTVRVDAASSRTLTSQVWARQP